MLDCDVSSETKENIQIAAGMREYNEGLHLSDVISGGKLSIHSITSYLNYVGDRDKRSANRFIAVTPEEFETSRREWISKRWDRLSGVAVVQCINNKHFQSVYIFPGRTILPIVGYDSKSIKNETRRTDFSGEDCSTIKDGKSWTTVVDEKEQRSVTRLVELISRVAETVVELNRGSMSPSFFQQPTTWSGKSFEVL